MGTLHLSTLLVADALSARRRPQRATEKDRGAVLLAQHALT